MGVYSSYRVQFLEQEIERLKIQNGLATASNPEKSQANISVIEFLGGTGI